MDPKGLSSFLACRLIALDKCPGIRPIGICETVRKIVSKAILYVIKQDIQEAAGTRQLCGGQIAGIEAAIHSVQSELQSEDTEAVLLVDASNTFNSLNREAALRNVQYICPPLATALINTYRSSSDLFAVYHLKRALLKETRLRCHSMRLPPFLLFDVWMMERT